MVGSAAPEIGRCCARSPPGRYGPRPGRCRPRWPRRTAAPIARPPTACLSICGGSARLLRP
eukprot:14230069-Alexandrium_andersonii.AAC.1